LKTGVPLSMRLKYARIWPVRCATTAGDLAIELRVEI
jgi:hypothetical protein